MHIKSLRPHGQVDQSSLVDLGTNPDMRDFMVGIIWKDGTVSVGWSGGMSHAELSYIKDSVTHEVTQRIFDPTNDDPVPELD